MKINWKARLKNPYFWIGLVGVILTAIGANPETLTSWGILAGKFCEVLENPFLLGTTCLAVLGVLIDTSTQGFADASEKFENEKKQKEKGE